MPHIHPVVDIDSKFLIDPSTRVISTSSDKLELVQGDHQSERITFEIPQMVEGHDMSLCDRIEIHYINIDKKTKVQSKDIYLVKDMSRIGDKLTFSWLISNKATKYYGKLNFIIVFKCFDTDGNCTYQWDTEICKLLTINEGLDNTNIIIDDFLTTAEEDILLSLMNSECLPVVADNGKILTANQKILLW